MTTAPGARGVDLTWHGRPEPRRGPRPTLTLDSIGAAAVALADRAATFDIAIEEIAAALDVTKMAIYRYTPSKDDLVHVMFHCALGSPPKVQLDTPWKTRTAAWTRALLRRYDRHPWIVDVPVGSVPLTRNQARWLDAGLQALAGAPVSRPDKLSGALLLHAHVAFTARLRRNARPDSPLLPPSSEGLAPSELSHAVADRAAPTAQWTDAYFTWGTEQILAGFNRFCAS